MSKRRRRKNHNFHPETGKPVKRPNPLDAEKIDWSKQIRFAERVRDRNTAKIESGETFRAHQTTSRKSPGKTA